MADSLAQSGIEQPTTDDSQEHVPSQSDEDTVTNLSASSVPEAALPEHSIIWTPRFLIIFVLTLLLGLSLESLLTQGWLNKLYYGEFILIGHEIIILGCWIALIIISRTWWNKLAGMFGCIWAGFSCINALISLFRLTRISPHSPIPAHVNLAYASALLGAYICLSINSTPFTRWDKWFFRIVPGIGIVLVLTGYFMLPPDQRPLAALESDAAAFATVMSMLLWWLRPSCWKAHPGPTFLFGLLPAITLWLSLPHVVNGEGNYFFSQVELLTLILAILRTIQGELRLNRENPQG